MDCAKLEALSCRAIQYCARCLVTTTVVIWLAVFAPLTCSYHGFLLHPGAVTPPDGTGMVIAFAPAMAHMAHGAAVEHAAAQPMTGFTTSSHHTSDGDTGMSSLLILAAPAGIHLPPPAVSGTFDCLLCLAAYPWPPPGATSTNHLILFPNVWIIAVVNYHESSLLLLANQPRAVAPVREARTTGNLMFDARSIGEFSHETVTSQSRAVCGRSHPGRRRFVYHFGCPQCICP